MQERWFLHRWRYKELHTPEERLLLASSGGVCRQS